MLGLAVLIQLAAWVIGVASFAMHAAASHEFDARLRADHPDLVARYRAGLGRVVDPTMPIWLALAMHREPVAQLSPHVAPVYADTIRYMRRLLAAVAVVLVVKVWQPAVTGS